MSIQVDNGRFDGNGQIHILALVPDGETITMSPDGRIHAVPGATLSRRHDRFVPVLGQTQFVLGQAPATTPEVFVNGQGQRDGVDFVLAPPRTVAWTSPDFALAPSDRLDVWYVQA